MWYFLVVDRGLRGEEGEWPRYIHTTGFQAKPWSPRWGLIPDQKMCSLKLRWFGIQLAPTQAERHVNVNVKVLTAKTGRESSSGEMTKSLVFKASPPVCCYRLARANWARDLQNASSLSVEKPVENSSQTYRRVSCAVIAAGVENNYCGVVCKHHGLSWRNIKQHQQVGPRRASLISTRP